MPVLESLIGDSTRSAMEIVAVYTQPDRPAGRGRRMSTSPVKKVATAAGLRIEQPETLKSPVVQETLHNLEPDLIVVVAYGLLLPKAVLELPSLACFNVHASLLPRWRGAAPIQRAILAGDKRSGVSIMKMSAGRDEGPLYLGRELCLENLLQVVSAGRESGNFLRIDMEDSAITDDTLALYSDCRESYDRVGPVLQAYLRRSGDDLALMAVKPDRLFAQLQHIGLRRRELEALQTALDGRRF